MKPQRLDKYIATQGALTRSAATSQIRRGNVTVNGTVLRDPSAKVNPETDAVSLCGNALTFSEHLYLILNKPAGILCVSRDPNAETVLDLVPQELRRAGMFPAGRLDKDTTGLVILTDDGDYGHRLTSPKHQVEKVYYARVDAPVFPGVIAAFEKGTHLPDGTPCAPAKLHIIEDGAEPLCEVTVTEGKYHQIKRMFGTHDLGVNTLHRHSIGALTLPDDLAEGEVRVLSDSEKDAVFMEKTPKTPNLL